LRVETREIFSFTKSGKRPERERKKRGSARQSQAGTDLNRGENEGVIPLNPSGGGRRGMDPYRVTRRVFGGHFKYEGQ